MKQIWKYPLELTEMQSIDMPIGAKPLSVGVQGRTPVLWAEVDPDKSLTSVVIQIIATGVPFGTNYNFVGTFQVGGFVGRVFFT
jgi:hypothetical protein